MNIKNGIINNSKHSFKECLDMLADASYLLWTLSWYNEDNQSSWGFAELIEGQSWGAGPFRMPVFEGLVWGAGLSDKLEGRVWGSGIIPGPLK